MKLTTAERLILVRQFEILALLNPAEAKSYGEMSEVLECGYEGLYPEVARLVSAPPMSAAECKLVADVLEMFSVLRASYLRLDDKRGIDARDVRFGGFDPEEEPRQLQLTRFLLDVQGKWPDLEDDTPGHCSPAPRLETYRRMLAKLRWYWNPRVSEALLTRDELVDVLSVVGHTNSSELLA